MNPVWTAPKFDPVAIWLGPLPVRWYALAYIGGLLLGWYYCRWLARRPALWAAQKAPSMTQIDDLIVYVTLGVVIGGRLGEVLFWNPERYFAHPVDIFKVWEGGMAFHGGLLGATLAVALFSWRQRLNTFALFDMCCAVAPIGLFLGRIANFVNGELWGREVPVGTANYPDFPYAMIFPYAQDGVPRYPSQLYEAVAEGLLLFIVVTAAVRLFGFRRPGIIGGIFLIGYCAARSVSEIFREPEAASFIDGITQGQALSIPMAVIGALVIALAFCGKTRSSTQEAA